MAVYQDLHKALRTSPLNGWRRWIPLFVAFSVAAIFLGKIGGIVHWGLIEGAARWYLPFTLFFFPALGEEFFFRGMLIGRDTAALGTKATLWRLSASSLVFTLWHPLNALTINPGAQSFFLNPIFLVIVFLLGLSTGAAYVISRSIWTPIIIHWVTVVIWVELLGGRNLILE